jgi:Na+/proline symporter
MWVEGESAWVQVDRWSVPILGSLIAQELMARVFSARSLQTARRATYWSALIYILLGACPVLLGLLGPQLLPHLADPEQLLPRLSQQLLPPVLQALFSCSLVAAILSTVDSILLASSALVAHNVLTPTFQVQSERTKLRLARLCVVVFGVMALTIALYAEGIYELVETASAWGTAGVLVVTLAALYLPWGGRFAAAAALTVGAIATPVLNYGFEVSAPFLGSVLCAVLAYSLTAWMERPGTRYGA